MSSTLFPLKALAIAAQLGKLKLPGIVQKHDAPNSLMALGESGWSRVSLSSSEVAGLIREQFQVSNFRARFAFKAKTGKQVPRFELFNAAGDLVVEPVLVSELDAALSNAIQVELLHLLLLDKGVNIPMM